MSDSMSAYGLWSLVIINSLVAGYAARTPRFIPRFASPDSDRTKPA